MERKIIEVTNRSAGNAGYSLPEINVRRVFTEGETKKIDSEELDLLYQRDGGKDLIHNFLLVNDQEWVSERWDAPLEYFWSNEDIIKCLKEDELELFSETIDYAPEGVIDLIKEFSWKLPLTDLNKVEVLKNKINFDAIAAAKIMETNKNKNDSKTTNSRLRQRG